jgi:hypothetical protein
MAYMKEITQYKIDVRKAIWKSLTIKALLSPATLTYEQFKKQVIPYGKNVETITEQKTFILYDVDPIKSRTSELTEYVIKFWVITHDDLNLTDDGVLVDLVVSELEELFADSKEFGIGKLTQGGAPSFVTKNGFSGRSLIYYTTDFRRSHQ